MYKIAIVEDMKEYRKQIERYLIRYKEEYMIQAELAFFEDGQDIIDEKESSFDLIFFDIDMPGVNGMDAAKQIRQRDQDVVIVFITNLTQYAIEGYAVGALDYVLKPVKYSAFALRLTRALEKVKKKKDVEVLINTVNGIKRLNSEEIHYIEIENRRLHYHTSNGEYVTRGTLKEAEEKLGEYHYVKCNQYYLVNLKYVSETKGNIAVVGGKELEISRRSKTSFANALTDYIGGGL